MEATMADRYPNAPGSRRGAPETSREAAESVVPIAKSHRALVFAAISLAGPTGLSGDSVAAFCELTVYQVRARIAELHADKRIADSGRREQLGSGRRGVVWVLREYGPAEPDDGQGDLLAA